jgi:hypothetical protein
MQFPVISSDATRNSSINTNVSSGENNITFVNTGNPAQGIDFIEAIITGDIEFIGSLPAVDLIRLDAGVTIVIKNIPVEEAPIKKELVTKKSEHTEHTDSSCFPIFFPRNDDPDAGAGCGGVLSGEVLQVPQGIEVY